MPARARVQSHPVADVPAVEFDGGVGHGSNIRPVQLMPGVRSWLNPVNDFLVLEVHYSASIHKRDPAWADEQSKIMGGRHSPDWRRFMDLDWSVRKGLKVFPEFVDTPGDPRDHHVIVPGCDIPKWWSCRRGLDPASVNPFAVGFWSKSPSGIHFCFSELYIRNAWCLKLNTPAGTMTGTNAVKYRIFTKSVGRTWDLTVVDPSANSKQLRGGGSGFGPESARSNLLEELRSAPYALDVDPAKRSGDEYLDIQNVRKLLFQRRRFKTLTPEELAVLGLEFHPTGYDLYGGYFFANCPAHIYEFKNLRFDEIVDPNVNAPESIQDKDNHTWDETKYVLSKEWDQNRKRPRDTGAVTDQRAVRAARAAKSLRDAGKAYMDRHSGRGGSGSYMESE